MRPILVAIPLALSTAIAAAQDRAEFEKLIARSLPPGEPVGADYTIVAQLDGLSFHGLESTGTFEGRDRFALTLHASAWAPGRATHLLASRGRVAFREEPGPRSSSWSTFEPARAREKEPAYAALVLPDRLLDRLADLVRSPESSGTRGFGAAECEGFRIAIPPREARALLDELGLVVESTDTVESVDGELHLWVGNQDGRLRSLELRLEAHVKPADREPPEGGGFSWESGGSGDLGGGSTRIPIQPSGGNAGGSGTPGAEGKARPVRDPRRQFQVDLRLHPAEPGLPDPAPIQPDPEAARQVDW